MFRTTVSEYQRGLKIKGGKIVAVLEPGKYFASPWSILLFDLRQKTLRSGVQEILTKDSINIRCSSSLTYEIFDPKQYFLHSQDPEEALYEIVHAGLRQLVGSENLADLLKEKALLGEKLERLIASDSKEQGISVVKAAIRDITLPKNIKDSLTEAYASKELGAAQLEAARAQTASMRHLANASKLIKENPDLIKLLALQTANRSGGHSVTVEFEK